MSTNRRFLKAFGHIDASGRLVPGMVILRKKKPPHGRWVEITETYLCCNPTTTTTTSTSTSTTTSTTSTTTTTTTTAPSDIRLKKNIRPTGSNLECLKEYTWEWNDEAIALGLGHFRTTGILAQEALKVFPEVVSVGPDGYYRVNYNLLEK